MTTANRLSVLFDLVTAQAEANARALSGSLIGIESAVNLAKTAFNAINAVLSSIGGVFGSAADEAMKFEAAMAEVQTLFGPMSVNSNKLRTELLAISNEFGTDRITATKAYYQAISSGAVNASTAQKLLVTANKLAVGGVTDLATAVDGITNVLNGWKLDVSESTRISDVFFIGMQKGKTTVGELASELNKASPIAAALGINFDELAAASATLTLSGTPTAETFTQLKAVMVALSKPTDAMKKSFKEAGISSIDLALKNDGLVNVLNKVAKTTDGTASGFNKLFSSEQAASAALALTGVQAEAFNDIMGAMKEASKTAGQTTEEAFKKIADTAQFQMTRAKTQLSNVFSEFGRYLLPVVGEISKGLADIADGIGKWAKENEENIKELVVNITAKVKEAFVVVKEFFSFLMDNSDTIKAISVGVLAGASAFTAWTIAVKAASVAATAFIAVQSAGGIKAVLASAVNPVVLLAVALGTLTAAAVWANDNIEQVAGVLYQLKSDILGVAIPAIKVLLSAFSAIAENVILAAKYIAESFQVIPKTIGDVVETIGKAVKSILSFLRPLAQFAGSSVLAAFDAVSSKIEFTAKDLNDQIKSTSKGVNAFFDGMAETARNSSNGVIKALEKEKRYTDAMVTELQKMYLKTKEAAKGAKSFEDAVNDVTEALGKPKPAAIKTVGEAAELTTEQIKKLKEELERQEENERNAYANKQTRLDDYRANFDAHSKGLTATQQELNKDLKELDEKQAKEKEKAAKDALEAKKKLDKEYEDSLKELANIMEKADDEERKRMLRRIEGFKVTLGIIKQIATGYTEMFSGVGGALPKIAAGDLFGGTKEAMAGLFSGLSEVAGGFARYFADTFASMVVGMAGKLSDALMAVAPRISEYLGGIVTEEFKEKFLALGTFAGEALAGGFKLAVGLLESSLQTAMATVQTLFQAVSGGFVASLASGVKGVLDSFESNIKAINEGTASILNFGKGDTKEKEKEIAEQERTEIASIKERYATEIEAARDAGGEISAEKKKILEADLKAIKAKEEADIKARKKAFEASAVVTDDKGLVDAELKRIKETENAEIQAKKRASDEAMRLLDEQKRNALAATGLSAQEKANITTLYAEKKAQEKLSLEDAVNAIKAKATADTERVKNLSAQEKTRIKEENAARKEADAERLASEIEAIQTAADAAAEAAKNRAAGITEEQQAKIAAIEAARDAEIQAAKDVAEAQSKNVTEKAENRNIFDDMISSVDDFVNAFIKKMPEIVTSFVTAVPKLIESFVKNVPQIVAAFTANLKPMIKALTNAIGPILSTVAQELPNIIGSIADSLPGIFEELAEYLPPVIGTLIDELVKALPKILPSFILLISKLIQTIISKVPDILRTILGIIPLILAELPKIFGSIIRAIPGIITSIIDSIPAIISAVIVAIPNIIGEIIKSLPQILLSVVMLIPSLIGSLIEGVIDGLGKILPNFLNAGKKIFEGFGDALKKAWTWLKQFGTQMWNGLKDGIVKAFEWIKGIGGWIWSGLSNGIVKAFEWIKGVGKWIWKGLSDGIYKALDWIKGIGKWIWDGLANGIYKAYEWIKGIGRWIWDGLANAIYEAGDWIASAFSWWSDGGIVGGNATFSGDDRRNDTVPAFLSPGELVVPRSAMDGGMSEIMSFVANALGQSTQRMAAGGVAGVESQRSQRGSGDDLKAILASIGGQEIVVQIDGQTVARAVRSQVQKGFKL